MNCKRAMTEEELYLTVHVVFNDMKEHQRRQGRVPPQVMLENGPEAMALSTPPSCWRQMIGPLYLPKCC